MIGFVLFTMNSCNKEAETMMPENQSSQLQSPKDRVLAFKEMLNTVKSGDISMRSSETYTAEELIWNVEANLNYTYAYAGGVYDDYATDTDTIEVPELGGEMSQTVVSRVYDEVLDSVSCFFYRNTMPHKKLKLVDVFPIDGQNAIGYTIILGNIFDNGGGFTRWIFEEGDDWKALQNGKCDATASSNAWKELSKSVTWNYPYPGAPRQAMTDIEAVFLTANHNFVGGDPYYGWNAPNSNDLTEPYDWVTDYATWRVVYCVDGNCDSEYDVIVDTPEFFALHCIDYNQMNNYSMEIENICSNVESGENKIFSHISMRGAQIQISGPFDDPKYNRDSWDGFVYVGLPVMPPLGVELPNCR